METLHLGAETRQAPAIQIADFRGDFAQVAAMIQESWKENGAQGLLYTPEFLSNCLDYPGCSPFLSPTLYQGHQPCAFVTGFPRNIRYFGNQLRVLVCTLLSVSSEYKKKGYGVVLWNEFVKRAQSAGFDGMVNYCVDGEPMNSMILGCCRMLKLPTRKIFSVPYLMRLLQPKLSPASSEPSAIPPAEQFLRAAALLDGNLPLQRVWTEPEAYWQLTRQDGLAAHHQSDGREGMLTAYLMHASNPQKTKCLLIEDILWGTLNAQERSALLEELLDRARAAGAQMAFLPCMEYADLAPFKAARFRSSPRTLHCYLTVFSGQPDPQPVSSMYLDVI